MKRLLIILTVVSCVPLLSPADQICQGGPDFVGGGTTEQRFWMRDGSLTIGFMMPKDGILRIMSMSYTSITEARDNYPDTYDMYVLDDGLALVFYKTIKTENRLKPVAVFTSNKEGNGLTENKALLEVALEKRLSYSTSLPTKPGEAYSMEIEDKD